MGLLKSFPQRIPAMLLFSPVVLFPSFLAEKMQATTPTGGPPTKVFTVWGARATSTPANYRQLLAQTLRKTSDIHCTPDTMPDGGDLFDARSMGVLSSLLPLVMR